MLHQQLLESWTNLQQKLRTTLNHLKTRTSPTILNLENQILTKLREIKTKQQQLNNLPSPSREQAALGEVPRESNDPYQQQRNNLNSQIYELQKQKDTLFQQLANTHPFLTELNHQLSIKDVVIKELHQHLHQKRENEQSLYEKQLTIMTDKWNASERKLDRIKDLIANNNLPKLKQLIQQGKI